MTQFSLYNWEKRVLGTLIICSKYAQRTHQVSAISIMMVLKCRNRECQSHCIWFLMKNHFFLHYLLHIYTYIWTNIYIYIRTYTHNGRAVFIYSFLDYMYIFFSSFAHTCPHWRNYTGIIGTTYPYHGRYQSATESIIFYWESIKNLGAFTRWEALLVDQTINISGG